MSSVVKINHNIRVMDNGKVKICLLSDLCVSGGIVNAYNALEMASHYK
jgi:hypothetical protein